MKLFLNIILSLSFKNIVFQTAVISLLSVHILYAQTGNTDPDDIQKIQMFPFQDISPAVSENISKKKPPEERFDYLSDIIPVNLKRDIEASGNYAITIERLSSEKRPESDDDILSFLKTFSLDKGAQISIYGTYSVIKSAITVQVYFYSQQTGIFKKIQTDGKKIGAMIDSLLSDLSSSSINQIQSMVVKRTPPPVISVSEEPVSLYGSVVLKPSDSSDDIWYTTDGSEPTKDSGTKYSEPIKIRKSTHIITAAIREGYSISKPVSKDITVTTPLSRFTIGQTFGSAQALRSMRHKVKTESMNHFSAFASWDLANIESLKNTGFLRNLGIAASFESARFSDRKSEGSGNLMLFNGLLQYSARLADFLSVDLNAGGGYAKVKHVSSDNGNGGLDIFSISTKSGESYNKTDFGAGIKFNYIWGRLFFHADASYRRITIPNDIFHCVFSGIGLGVRF
jgi:hypothetical protein